MQLILPKIGTNFMSTHYFSYLKESVFSEKQLCFFIKAYVINVYNIRMYREDIS